ncbi:MAG: hypothetical protein OXH76_11080, partial [Boseongicola sp.]|nr:hypothetical protein [Boseongicola sp.]
MAWKAFLIEPEADVGILSEAVPETVRGIGVTGQAARRMGRRSRRRRVRIDWLKPARLGLQSMVRRIFIWGSDRNPSEIKGP